MIPGADDSGTAPAARPFVGRERELAEIGRALDEARAGRGRLVLLAGEPGVGKTRLADESSLLASGRGVPVLWGRCWEAGGAPAYWPWLDVLSGLARLLDDAALRQALGDGAAAIGELLPALGPRLGPAPATAPPSAGEARFRLWRAAAGLMREGAAPAALMVVLDDLHAADESSLLLLHFLARELRTMRVLLVGTYRDVEARLAPAAGELLARIAREGLLLSVGRLDREASTRFLRQRAGAVDAPVEARILASTQGNPLFLEEMARLLADEGATSIAAGAVPQGVREVIRQRLERVPPETRPLLDLAAVSGDEIDPALLAAAAGRDAASVAAALETARRAGVLATRAGERLRFSHALVREVLYRDLAEDARRALHGAVGEALERLPAASGSPPLAEMAHHGLEGPVAGVERAVGFAIRAAARALDVHAYEEAVALLSRAVTSVERAGDPAPLRARALLALAEARIRGGEGAAGRAVCLEVAALARRAGDPALLAEVALLYGQVFTLAVVDPLLVGLLEEAIAGLPPGDSSVRVRLMARLAAALQPSPDMREPVRIAHEAIAAARRLGDAPTLLGAIHAGMSAFMDVVRAGERLPLNLEAERLATALADRERLLRTEARLVVDHMEIGDWAAVDARIGVFETLARELHAPWYAWRGFLFRSMRALVHGRFEEAERFAAEGRRAGRAVNDPDVERCWTMHQAGLLRGWERHEDMLAFDVQARRVQSGIMAGPAWQALGSAVVAARMEDEQSARMHLALVPDELCPPTANPYALFFAAEPAALVGSPELAARLHRALVPEEDRDVMLGLTALLWEGPVTRLLALLAARLGLWDEACARFEAALARIERLDAQPYLARTRYEYGRTLLARGHDRDRERARALLGAARDLAATLGQTGLVRLAGARLAALGAAPAREARGEPAPPPVAPVAARPALPSMSLEGEYWLLSHGPETVRLKDSLGLQYLARLLSSPDRELHVLDLARAREGGEAEIVDRGDAGELLDAEARESYRRRLEDLRDALAEAESFGDAARAARAREEIEFLTAELGRAVGLGGRARRAGVAAERARSAVQRRIRNALERIGEHAPALAAYLGRTVRTGTFCVFRPDAAR